MEVGSEQPGLLQEFELALDVRIDAHEEQAGITLRLWYEGTADAQDAVAIADRELQRGPRIEAVARIGAPDVSAQRAAQAVRIFDAVLELVVWRWRLCWRGLASGGGGAAVVVVGKGASAAVFEGTATATCQASVVSDSASTAVFESASAAAVKAAACYRYERGRRYRLGEGVGVAGFVEGGCGFLTSEEPSRQRPTILAATQCFRSSPVKPGTRPSCSSR